MLRLLDKGAIRGVRTELEVAADLKIAMLQEGGQGEAFSTIVVGGPNSASPHAGPSDRLLEEGDLVIIDWGAICEGYRSDITRTFVLGKPSAEMIRVHTVDVMFRDFLAEKYGSIEDVNLALGTGFGDWLEVLPPQRQLHYGGFVERKGALGWECVRRN